MGISFDDMKTVKEVALYLHVSEKRVNQFIDDGRLGFVKRGRTRYISLQELERFESIPRTTGRPPAEAFSDMLTAAEAAPLLGVTEGRVRAYVAEGRLPSVLRSGTRYIARRHVLALAAVPSVSGRPRDPDLDAAAFTEKRRASARRASARRRLARSGIS